MTAAAEQERALLAEAREALKECADDLEAEFAAVIAAARHQERERCALWCDVIGKDWEDDGDYRARDAAKYLADWLRNKSFNLDPAAIREDKQ
jgi:hypothetical protein